MRKLLSGRTSVLAVFTATVALVVMAGGGAVAGSLITSAKIKNNTIQGIDVKNGSLTGSDIKNSSVTGSDVKPSTLAGSDIANGTLTGADVKDGTLGGADTGVYFATVNSDGTKAGGSAGTSSAKVGTGGYEVLLPRADIRSCGWTVTTTTPSGIFPPQGNATTADRTGKNNAVFVATRDNADAAADIGFHIVVVC